MGEFFDKLFVKYIMMNHDCQTGVTIKMNGRFLEIFLRTNF